MLLQVHGRQARVDGFRQRQARLVLGVGAVQEPVADQAKHPRHHEADQQRVTQRSCILGVPFGVSHRSARPLLPSHGPHVAVPVLRHQADDRRGTGCDRNLHTAVVGVDHASQVVRHNLGEDGANAGSCGPAGGQPHQGHEDRVRVEVGGDAGAVRQQAQQHRTEQDAAHSAYLGHHDAAVLCVRHAGDVADEAPEKRSHRGGHPKGGNQQAGMPVRESHELEPEREVAECKPGHGAGNALQDDDLEAADSEDCPGLQPHGVGDGAPREAARHLAGVHRVQHHHGAGKDADHRGAVVGKAPALDAERRPATDVGRKHAGEHAAKGAGHVQQAKGLAACACRVVVRDQALAAGDDQ
mmetsp:Transcript_2423/g.6095  ORF Transcript_2423/g.6095 Transcript_2423/m.6095 type:complete len:355 (-) Transcript_2423:538-1602(-)